ncbi:MAG: RNA polymerase sigma factor [Verrucomicrobiales bacterium]|nr:RNA polymerase sigma factor [Verrucomicrobiae bacterium]
MEEVSSEHLASDVVAAQLLGMRLELTGFVRAMVRDVHSADDIFQETCVKAVREAGTRGFSGVEHVRRWAFVTAKHAAVDLLRHRSRKHGEVALSEELLELLANEQAESPQSCASSGNALRALGRCLEGLTPRSRKVLALRYGEELSGIEVAKRLDRKVDSIYKSLARIYAQLRVCIRQRLLEEEA